MNVENFNTIDPFADEGGIDLDDKDVGSQKDVIHIRIQQRNGRKSLTTVQGIPKEYDAQKLVKKLRKEFACNGKAILDDQVGQVIQFQGDQRDKIRAYLEDKLKIPKVNIKRHGF